MRVAFGGNPTKIAIFAPTKKYFDGWLNNFSTIPVSADNRDNVKTSS